jgi:hypothetical protein
MPSPTRAAARPAPRRPLVRALLVAVAFVVAGAWYAFRPDRLLTASTVTEAAPVAAAPPAATPAAAAPAPGAAAAPALARGRFHSNAHETVGAAAVLDLGGGRRVLRLTGFRTSNGPDVRVVLVAAPDVADDATATRAGYVELGALKGTRGDQNYEVPASIDLAKYRTVTIWCERFDVNFGSAPLAGA